MSVQLQLILLTSLLAVGMGGTVHHSSLRLVVTQEYTGKDALVLGDYLDLFSPLLTAVFHGTQHLTVHLYGALDSAGYVTLCILISSPVSGKQVRKSCRDFRDPDRLSPNDWVEPGRAGPPRAR